MPKSTHPLKASLHHLNRFTMGGPWAEGGGVWDERGQKVLHKRVYMFKAICVLCLLLSINSLSTFAIYHTHIQPSF